MSDEIIQNHSIGIKNTLPKFIQPGSLLNSQGMFIPCENNSTGKAIANVIQRSVFSLTGLLSNSNVANLFSHQSNFLSKSCSIGTNDTIVNPIRNTLR